MDAIDFEKILRIMCLDLKNNEDWYKTIWFVRRNCCGEEERLNLATRILIDKFLSSNCYDIDFILAVIKMYVLQLANSRIRQIPLPDRTDFRIKVRDSIFANSQNHQLIMGVAIDTALSFTDVKLLSTIVKYGYISSSAYGYFKRASTGLAILKFCDLIQENGYPGNDIENRMFDLAEELLEKREDEEDWFVSHRFYLIMVVLQAVMMYMKEDSRLEKYKLCSRLVFSITRAPFVSQSEIKNFLLDFFNHNSYNALMDTMSVKYSILFKAENAESNRPRKLKHLCRCFLRQTFSKSKKVLPELVSGLDIPVTLKEYLLGGPILV